MFRTYKLNLIIIGFLGIINGASFSTVFASIQNYEAKLTGDLADLTDCITIDPESLISWGDIYENQIHLFEIPAAQDGYAQFYIGNTSTDHIEVGLATQDLSEQYIFIFRNGVFEYEHPQSGGPVSGPYASGTIPNTYSSTIELMVEKCGDKVRFFREGDLLAEACINTGGASLIQWTRVVEATNTDLSLHFDDNIPACSPVSFTDGTSPTSFAQIPVTLLQEKSVAQAPVQHESQQLKPDQELTFPSGAKMLRVNAYDQNGFPVKSWKIRSTSTSRLAQNNEILDYLNNGYQIKVFTERKTHTH